MIDGLVISVVCISAFAVTACVRLAITSSKLTDRVSRLETCLIESETELDTVRVGLIHLKMHCDDEYKKAGELQKRILQLENVVTDYRATHPVSMGHIKND